jgi:hypothetical protein
MKKKDKTKVFLKNLISFLEITPYPKSILCFFEKRVEKSFMTYDNKEPS